MKETKEIVDARYYCRELQAKNILASSEKYFKEEQRKNSEDFEALGIIMFTPPIVLHSMINEKPELEKSLYEKAGKATTRIAQKARVLEVLNCLSRATLSDSRQITEVAIDYTDLSISKSFEIAFSKYPELLKSNTLKGREEAWTVLLNHLQREDVPLIRLRRDSVNQIGLSLTPTLDGEIDSLPTKIPEVYVRFFYPKNEQLPKLSLVVKPFENS